MRVDHMHTGLALDGGGIFSFTPFHYPSLSVSRSLILNWVVWALVAD